MGRAQSARQHETNFKIALGSHRGRPTSPLLKDGLAEAELERLLRQIEAGVFNETVMALEAVSGSKNSLAVTRLRKSLASKLMSIERERWTYSATPVSVFATRKFTDRCRQQRLSVTLDTSAWREATKNLTAVFAGEDSAWSLRPLSQLAENSFREAAVWQMAEAASELECHLPLKALLDGRGYYDLQILWQRTRDSSFPETSQLPVSFYVALFRSALGTMPAVSAEHANMPLADSHYFAWRDHLIDFTLRLALNDDLAELLGGPRPL